MITLKYRDGEILYLVIIYVQFKLKFDNTAILLYSDETSGCDF